MQPYYDGLLEKLRAARTQSGMTQREASVALGMAHSYMNKYESGERAIDIAELWALSRLYGKPKSFFAPRTDGKQTACKVQLQLCYARRCCEISIGNDICDGLRTGLRSFTYARKNSLTNLDFHPLVLPGGHRDIDLAHQVPA